MLGLEVATWFHHQGQHWGSYVAQGEVTPWPQSAVLCAPERRLFVAAAGGGGGAQQALFHEELLAYLQAGLRGWPNGAPLADYFTAVQAAFDEARTPDFCDHFQGSAVAAQVDPAQIAVVNLGCERAYLFNAGGALQRLTEDCSVGANLPDDDLSPTATLLRTLPTSWFRQGAGEQARPRVTEVAWGRGDLLLLITGLATIGLNAEVSLPEALVQTRGAPLPVVQRELVEHLKRACKDSRQSRVIEGRCAMVLVRQSET